jgi:hypothetical protein
MATGAEIKRIYDAMVEICKETGKLIEELNGLFEGIGFQASGGTGIMKGTSNSYKKPDYWVPYYAQRVYIKQNLPSKGVGINILFYDSALKNTAPIVSCGLINRTDGKQVVLTWDLYYAGWGKYGEYKKRPNSIFYDGKYSKYNESEIVNYFIPLDIINNRNRIKDYIVQPLAKMYEGSEIEAYSLIKDVQ